MSGFVGRGWAFPPHIIESSRVATVGGDPNIQRSIYIILNTMPGERILRPDFGCQIHDLVFWPVNDQTATLAERYVREALERWEPRINVHEVTVSPYTHLDGHGELYIQITYEIKNQHDVRSLVYPFTLLPG